MRAGRMLLLLLCLLCGACNSAPPVAEKRPARPASRIPNGWRTLASENFRVGFTPQTEQKDVELALQTLETARTDMMQRLGTNGLELNALHVEALVYATAGDFAVATGRPVWAGAVTEGAVIKLQPLATLRQRRVLAATLRHEYAHAVIEHLSRGRAPRWLQEGLAIHFAGEGSALPQNVPPLTVGQIETSLADIQTLAQMQQLYAAAYREVAQKIGREGEAAVWRSAQAGL